MGTEVFEFNQTMIDDLLVKYKRELSLRRKYFNMVHARFTWQYSLFCRFRPLPFDWYIHQLFSGMLYGLFIFQKSD